jgi:hypothetical protein
VDDILSKNLAKQVKTFPEINEWRVYESVYLDNVFEVLMIRSSGAMNPWRHGTQARLEPTWQQHGDF